MKRINENMKEIGFLLIVMMLLLYVSLTPNQDVEDKKEFLRMERLKDSLETEYYKKELESYPYNHSKIKDTIK
jgi:hypothetical protein